MNEVQRMPQSWQRACPWVDFLTFPPHPFHFVSWHEWDLDFLWPSSLLPEDPKSILRFVSASTNENNIPSIKKQPKKTLSNVVLHTRKPMSSVINLGFIIMRLDVIKVSGMPLANMRHKISLFSQQGRISILKSFVPILVAWSCRLVSTIILSRVQCRSTDPTNTGGDTIVRKPHSMLTRQFIQKGSMDDSIGGNAQIWVVKNENLVSAHSVH